MICCHNMLRCGCDAAYSGFEMITRFAPSPTGRLHLGHAYSAMMAWDIAQQNGGAFRLRLDDLDVGRVRAEFETAILDDLAWLGLMPGGAIIKQSDRTAHYAAALDRLKAMGLAYPCFCTRAQISAQIDSSIAAPHGAEQIYPGTCRNLDAASCDHRLAAESHCWRLDMTGAVARSGPLHWRTANHEPVQANPGAHGDIVLMRKDGAASYHLASSIDDADMGITHVVRGADLLASTDVHCLLQAILGLSSPIYHHHALIAGADGKRLAKRNDAAELTSLRVQGVDAAQLMAGLRLGHLPLGYRWAKA